MSLHCPCCGQLWVRHMICGQTCVGPLRILLDHFGIPSEIDHIHLSSEAQCVSHLLPQVDCHKAQTHSSFISEQFLDDFYKNILLFWVKTEKGEKFNEADCKYEPEILYLEIGSFRSDQNTALVTIWYSRWEPVNLYCFGRTWSSQPLNTSFWHPSVILSVLAACQL